RESLADLAGSFGREFASQADRLRWGEYSAFWSGWTNRIPVYGWKSQLHRAHKERWFGSIQNDLRSDRRPSYYFSGPSVGNSSHTARPCRDSNHRRFSTADL